eukprot:14724.XXX_470446_471420_1 [CDS] Oithona nana genome sequencing.
MFKEQREELLHFQNHFKKNQKLREYSSHISKVHSVSWSCDGKRLASGSLDKTVCLFSLSHDRLSKEHTYRGHGDSVDQLCWHPTNPDLLATASGDKTVRIWESRSSKALATIQTKGENINIAWSSDGKTLAVGNKEDLVTFIDVQTHKIILEEQFKFEVNEISWNKNSDLFFLTNGQGCVHVYTYPEMKLQHVLQAHPANCICIEFDPTGKYFAVGSADALVSLWNVNELACVRTFSFLEWPVRTISFSYDGKLIASASEDLCISIAHVETGAHVAKIPVTSPTFSIAWHPKRYLLAYSCDDKDKYDRDRDSGSLKVWGFESSD